jgi:hypothetical protein
MQQPPISPASGGGKSALQYGLIFGGIIGLIDVLYSYLLSVANIPVLGALSSALSSLPPFLFSIIYAFIVSIPIYILLFVSFLLAGLFAARKSKRAASGTMAGLIVGGIYVLVDLLFATLLLLYLVTFPQIAEYTPPASMASTESSILIPAISYSIVAGLILIGIGCLVGLLGGLMGRGGKASTQLYSPYVPNPYQPQPSVYANPQQDLYPYGQPVQPPSGQAGQTPPSPPISGQ